MPNYYRIKYLDSNWNVQYRDWVSYGSMDRALKDFNALGGKDCCLVLGIEIKLSESARKHYGLDKENEKSEN
jgi:hypothetical protein